MLGRKKNESEHGAESDDVALTGDVAEHAKPTSKARSEALKAADQPPPRRRASRRSSRRLFRKVTPRRWLPFVVFVAVVAATVIVTTRTDEAETLTKPVANPSGMIPVAAPTDALSTAFFCPGGAATGAKGTPQLSVVIANARATSAKAEATIVGSDGALEQISLEVPSYGRTVIRANEHVTADWAAMTVEVLGGDISVQQLVTEGARDFDLSPCPTSTSDEWFVPSGSTAIGALEDLLVYNPFPAPAVVSLEFSSSGGVATPRPLQSVTVPGLSLRVFSSDELPARRDQIATRLTTRTGQVVFGRVQRYDGKGSPFEAVRQAPEVAAPIGVAANAAIPAPSTRWVFPEAVNDPAVRNAVVIYNPSETTAEINLLLSYSNRELNAEIEPIQVTVRGKEQQVVDLRDRPGLEDSNPYTVVIDSFAANDNPAVPVVAELQLFGAVQVVDVAGTDEEPPPDTPESEGTGETAPDGAGPDEAPPEDEGPSSRVIKGYAAVTGSPVSATAWIVADVAMTKDRTGRVVVFNPGVQRVEIEVFLVADARRESLVTFTLEKGDRRSLDLSTLPATSTLAVSSRGGGVVVGQSSTAVSGQGVAQVVASPVPGTVRTLPPPLNS